MDAKHEIAFLDLLDENRIVLNVERTPALKIAKKKAWCKIVKAMSEQTGENYSEKQLYKRWMHIHFIYPFLNA